jgi:hypothetical protein
MYSESALESEPLREKHEKQVGIALVECPDLHSMLIAEDLARISHSPIADLGESARGK